MEAETREKSEGDGGTEGKDAVRLERRDAAGESLKRQKGKEEER